MTDRNCKRCGGKSFKEGMLGSGHANVKEVDKNLRIGERLLVTFCLACGEVDSMRVENPDKFK